MADLLARLAAADLSEELHAARRAVARAAGDLCGNTFTKRGASPKPLKFIFALSPYRAVVGRGLSRPDLGEVVLACVGINRCSLSPIQHDDSGKF